jgi:hypothetical protein
MSRARKPPGRSPRKRRETLSSLDQDLVQLPPKEQHRSPRSIRNFAHADRQQPQRPREIAADRSQAALPGGGVPPPGAHVAPRQLGGRRVVRQDDLESLRQASHDLFSARVTRVRRTSDASNVGARRLARLSRSILLKQVRRFTTSGLWNVRWISHGLLFAVSASIAPGSLRTPLLVVAVGAGAVVILSTLAQAVPAALFLGLAWMRNAVRSLRHEPRNQPPIPRWEKSPAARLLNWVAMAFPADFRAQYVEDQCANLAATESNWEWFCYVIDQIIHLPIIAWTFYAELRRGHAR